MAFKRLSATILIQNDQVVKSYQFMRFYPFGSLGTALTILDKWCVDEIIILDISRKRSLSDYVLHQISTSYISTPLIYGGGISNIDDVTRLISLGCDRIIVEDALFSNHHLIHLVANKFGSQAVIGSLPMSFSSDSSIVPSFPDYIYQNYPNCSVTQLLDVCEELPLSEILVTDFRNEGCYDTFDLNLPAYVFHVALFSKGVLFYGGLSETLVQDTLKYQNTVGLLFGNPNLENELFIPSLKAQFKKCPLFRPLSSLPD